MSDRGNFHEKDGHTKPGIDASWALDNAIRPFASTLSEPFNSFVAPLAETVVEACLGKKVDCQLDFGTTPETEAWSAEWATQNVSKAVAVTGIYAVAQSIASRPLRLLGYGSHCLGNVAVARSLPFASFMAKGVEKLALNKSSSMILGAASYEGLRKERPGETHAGNFWGTAAGFTIFEAGNAGCKLPGVSLANIASYNLKRALVGAAGGAVQIGIAKSFAGHDVVSSDLAAGSISGAVINTLFGLPTINRTINRATKNDIKLSQVTDFGDRNIVVKKAKDVMTESNYQLPERVTLKGSEQVTVQRGIVEEVPFSDFGDFLYRGVSNKKVDMDVFQVDGHNEVKLLVSKPDLAALNKHNKDSGNTLQMMTSVLDQSPQSSMVKRIVLVNSESPNSVWLSQNKLLAPGERIYGDYSYKPALNDFEVRLFKPESLSETSKTYLHEWVHVAEQRHKELFNMTKLAHELEGDCGFLHKGCASPETYSSSVLLGDYLLSEHPIIVADAIGRAPIQALTALRCLEKVMPEKSAGAMQARAVITSTKASMTQLVLDKLIDLTGGDKADIARRLIAFLSD